MEQQLVIFKLVDESYGVDIAAVEAIIKMQDITRVPRLPRFVEGITNLRGMVIPVIDLRKRFEIPQEQLTENSRIIVINMNDLKVGMIVDSVSEVLRVSDALIDPPPTLAVNADTTFISGIVRLDNRLVIMLDMTRLLSGKEKSALTKIA